MRVLAKGNIIGKRKKTGIRKVCIKARFERSMVSKRVRNVYLHAIPCQFCYALTTLCKTKSEACILVNA